MESCGDLGCNGQVTTACIEKSLAYVDACLEEAGDDPAFIAHALGNVARAHGMSQVARESLYKALSGEGNSEFDTILKVMKALGLRLHASVA